MPVQDVDYSEEVGNSPEKMNADEIEEMTTGRKLIVKPSKADYVFEE